jgi:hypothetical protein
LVASRIAAASPARRPPIRATPQPSAMTAITPSVIGATRACQVPTPKVAKAAYSRPVKTGAM